MASSRLFDEEFAIHEIQSNVESAPILPRRLNRLDDISFYPISKLRAT